MTDEFSSVGGVVLTSPPRHTDECPSQTFEGASSPGVTLDPTTCVCHRAAPTSTPLDKVQQRIEARLLRLRELNPRHHESLTAILVDVRLLAASPASALVTKPYACPECGRSGANFCEHDYK
jgi:hypothetical protein